MTNSSRRFLTTATAAALTLLPATGLWALGEPGGMVFDGASQSSVGVCPSTFGTVRTVDLWFHHDPHLPKSTDGVAARTWHGQQFGGVLLNDDENHGWRTYRTLGSVHTPSPVRLHIRAAGNLSAGRYPIEIVDKSDELGLDPWDTTGQYQTVIGYVYLVVHRRNSFHCWMWGGWGETKATCEPRLCKAPTGQSRAARTGAHADPGRYCINVPAGQFYTPMSRLLDAFRPRIG